MPAESDSNTLALARQLIRCRSITPQDAGCQQLIAKRLQDYGCEVQHLPFADVSNLWLTHGQGTPLLVFAGHTDVVPPGPQSAWQTDPFAAEVRDDYLHGRGAADMKGGVAAMVTAFETFIREQPSHPGTLALLLTSDEEGVATDGTRRVMEHLQKQGIRIDWCVVGEPSSEKYLGDVIRNGRRGSLNGKLTIQGIQGHIAYPEKALNPIHAASELIQKLGALTWPSTSDAFPPTRLQFSHIHAGDGTENIIPGQLELQFNIRFSPAQEVEELKETVEQLVAGSLLKKMIKQEISEPKYKLEWRLSGLPFLTPEGQLLQVSRQAIKTVCNRAARCSTAGGTSDARFIAPTGAEVIELGLCNQTIHQANECVSVAELQTLHELYQTIIRLLLAD